MVRHILKDGSEVKSIAGHKVKLEDTPIIYELITRINRGAKGGNK